MNWKIRLTPGRFRKLAPADLHFLADDPAQLPAQVAFFAEEARSSFSAAFHLLAGFGILLLALLLAFMSWQETVVFTPEDDLVQLDWDNALLILLTPVAFFFAFRYITRNAWLLLNRRLKPYIGFYLTPGYLLQRTYYGRINVFPLEKIREVRLTQSTSNTRGQSIKTTYLKVYPESGAAYRYEWESKKAPELLEALETAGIPIKDKRDKR